MMAEPEPFSRHSSLNWPAGSLSGSLDPWVSVPQTNATHVHKSPHLSVVNSEANSLPTVILTEDDLADPIGVIEAHREAGRQYGAIKIVVPQKLRKMIGEPRPVDPSTFEFSTTKLRSTTTKEEYRKRVEFVDALFRFHADSSSDKRDTGPTASSQADPPTKDQDVQDAEGLQSSGSMPQGKQYHSVLKREKVEKEGTELVAKTDDEAENAKSETKTSTEVTLDTSPAITPNGTNRGNSEAAEVKLENSQVSEASTPTISYSEPATTEKEMQPELQSPTQAKTSPQTTPQPAPESTLLKPELPPDTPTGIFFPYSPVQFQPPKLGNKIVDLYTLYHLVIRQGGFQYVNEHNGWSEVGSSMGYTPAEVANWKFHLAAIYQSNLLRFEQSNFQETNGHKRSANDTIAVAGSSSIYRRFTRTKIARGVPLNMMSYVQVAPGVNGDEMKISPTGKRFKLGHAMENLAGGNVEDKEGLSRSTTAGATRTLRDMTEKNARVLDRIAGKHSSKITNSATGAPEVSLEDFEAIFWDEISEKSWDALEVEFARDIIQTAMTPRFREVGVEKHEHVSDVQSTAEEARCLWNMNNIALAPNSVLGTLSNSDCAANIGIPSINVGMALSYDNWRSEDHFLALCDYQESGAPRVWNFVAEKDAEKFEKLVEKLTAEAEMPTTITGVTGQEKQSVLAASLDTVPFRADSRRYPHRSNLLDMFPGGPGRSSTLKSDALDTLVLPETLRRHGISVCSVMQFPGEYIIKYPRVYSSTLHTGVGVSSKVHTAPPSWMEYASAGEQWLSSRLILPAFLVFKMLTNFANCYDNGNGRVNFGLDFFGVASEHLSARIESELALRDQVRRMLHHAKDTAVDEKNTTIDFWISDVDLRCVFPTRVVVTALHLALEIVMSMENFMDVAEEVMSNHAYRVELQVCYPDERLRSFCRALSGYSVNFNEWLSSCQEFFSVESQPSLRSIKALLADGDRIHQAMKCSVSGSTSQGDVGEFLAALGTLRLFVHRANNVVDECQLILNVKHQQRIRGGTGGTSPDTDAAASDDYFSRLCQVLRMVPTLGFVSPETDQIVELRTEIENFDRAARQLMGRPLATAKEFADLIELGTSFGLVLPSLSLLQRLKNRLEWTATFDTLVSGGDPFATKADHYTLEHLVDFLLRGSSILGSGDVSKLDTITKMVGASQKVSAAILQSVTVEYADELDPQVVEDIIVEVEARSRSSFSDRIVPSAAVYSRLGELRSQSAMLEKYNSMLKSMREGTHHPYQHAKNILKQTEASGMRFKSNIIAHGLTMCDDWLLSLGTFVESAQYPRAVEADGGDGKLGLVPSVVKKLRQMEKKTEESLAFGGDEYEQSSSYQEIMGGSGGNDLGEDGENYELSNEKMIESRSGEQRGSSLTQDQTSNDLNSTQSAPNIDSSNPDSKIVSNLAGIEQHTLAKLETTTHGTEAIPRNANGAIESCLSSGGQVQVNDENEEKSQGGHSQSEVVAKTEPSEPDAMQPSPQPTQPHKQESRPTPAPPSIPIYCLCRQPEFGDMIGCDVCKEWYHTLCVHAAESMDDDSDSKYICPMCTLVEFNKTAVTTSSATISSLSSLAKASMWLIVQPPIELELVTKLLEHVEEWQEGLKMFLRGADILGDKERLDRYRFVLRKLYGLPVMMDNMFREVMAAVKKMGGELKEMTEKEIMDKETDIGGQNIDDQMKVVPVGPTEQPDSHEITPIQRTAVEKDEIDPGLHESQANNIVPQLESAQMPVEVSLTRPEPTELTPVTELSPPTHQVQPIDALVSSHPAQTYQHAESEATSETQSGVTGLLSSLVSRASSETHNGMKGEEQMD